MWNRLKWNLGAIAAGIFAVVAANFYINARSDKGTPDTADTVSGALVGASKDDELAQVPSSKEADETAWAARFDLPRPESTCGNGRCEREEWAQTPEDAWCEDCLPEKHKRGTGPAKRRPSGYVLYARPSRYIGVSDEGDRGQDTFDVDNGVRAAGLSSVDVTQLAPDRPDAVPARMRICAVRSSSTWCSSSWGSFSPQEVVIPPGWSLLDTLIVQWEGASYLSYALDPTLN